MNNRECAEELSGLRQLVDEFIEEINQRGNKLTIRDAVLAGQSDCKKNQEVVDGIRQVVVILSEQLDILAQRTELRDLLADIDDVVEDLIEDGDSISIDDLSSLIDLSTRNRHRLAKIKVKSFLERDRAELQREKEYINVLRQEMKESLLQLMISTGLAVDDITDPKEKSDLDLMEFFHDLPDEHDCIAEAEQYFKLLNISFLKKLHYFLDHASHISSELSMIESSRDKIVTDILDSMKMSVNVSGSKLTRMMNSPIVDESKLPNKKRRALFIEEYFSPRDKEKKEDVPVSDIKKER